MSRLLIKQVAYIKVSETAVQQGFKDRSKIYKRYISRKISRNVKQLRSMAQL
jgi:hypothetical protein